MTQVNTLNRDIKQPSPIESSQHEPRDKFEIKPMNENINKFKNIVQECVREIKEESSPKYVLKESLRGLVRKFLMKEASTSVVPEPTKEETETINKQYAKDGNKRYDITNEKQLDELEKLVHGIDATWDAYIDDHGQFIVRAQNMLYVRICPKFEDNYDVDAMVKLVDRVRAISLTWEQVKAFVKANFNDLKKETNSDALRKQSLDNYKDNTDGKEAGPKNDIIKNRGEKKNGEDAKIKSTKNKEMDYNEPAVKKDEDMPDQPMKQVTKPGKDPEGKNKNIKKTEKVAPPKHKNDKKLKVDDKKTPKFKR